MKILYVEDSQLLVKSVSSALKRAGFSVDTALDGQSGLDLALTETFDVIVLDIMLPVLDGMTVLAEIRRAAIDAPILMLSARVTTEDRVAGLNQGADDYLVKPFQIEELVARLHALSRRRYGLQGNRIELGNLSIDLSSQRVYVGGEEIHLRPRELEILKYLSRRAGSVVSRSEILEHVYDHAADLKSNAIDVAVCIARKQLREAGSDTNIQAVPRRGYLIEGENERSGNVS